MVVAAVVVGAVVVAGAVVVMGGAVVVVVVVVAVLAGGGVAAFFLAAATRAAAAAARGALLRLQLRGEARASRGCELRLACGLLRLHPVDLALDGAEQDPALAQLGVDRVLVRRDRGDGRRVALALGEQCLLVLCETAALRVRSRRETAVEPVGCLHELQPVEDARHVRGPEDGVRGARRVRLVERDEALDHPLLGHGVPAACDLQAAARGPLARLHLRELVPRAVQLLADPAELDVERVDLAEHLLRLMLLLLQSGRGARPGSGRDEHGGSGNQAGNRRTASDEHAEAHRCHFAKSHTNPLTLMSWP